MAQPSALPSRWAIPSVVPTGALAGVVDSAPQWETKPSVSAPVAGRKVTIQQRLRLSRLLWHPRRLLESRVGVWSPYSCVICSMVAWEARIPRSQASPHHRTALNVVAGAAKRVLEARALWQCSCPLDNESGCKVCCCLPLPCGGDVRDCGFVSTMPLRF